MGHWNEAVFSSTSLSRHELVDRLSALFARHGLQQGHRYRMLTRGHAIAGTSLREVRGEVEEWRGVTFDLTWPEGDEVDFRMWRDELGDHHVVIGESSATLAARLASGRMVAFAWFCIEVCAELGMRYVVYGEEKLDHEEKLAGVDSERAQAALADLLHPGDGAPAAGAPSPALVVLPENEHSPWVAASGRAPLFVVDGLACWIFE